MEEHAIAGAVDETGTHRIGKDMSPITGDLHGYEPRTSPSAEDAGLTRQFQDMSVSPNESSEYENYRASGPSTFQPEKDSAGYAGYSYPNQVYMENYGQHAPFMHAGGPETANPYVSYSEEHAYTYPQDPFDPGLGNQNIAPPSIHGQRSWHEPVSPRRDPAGVNPASSRPTGGQTGHTFDRRNRRYTSPTTASFQQPGPGGYGGNPYAYPGHQQSPGYGNQAYQHQQPSPGHPPDPWGHEEAHTRGVPPVTYASSPPEQVQGYAYHDEIDEEQFGVWAEEEQKSTFYPPAGGSAYASRHGPVADGRLPNSSYDPRRATRKQKRTSNPEFTRHDSRDFKVGRVLKILWSEPKGSEAAAATNTFCSTMQRDVHQKNRRFIILEGHRGHSICAPIMTYGGQGCKKSGAHPEDHGIVYTGDVVPPALDGEGQLGYPAIQMIPLNHTDRLQPQSRVNYTKKYTIEHNFKVEFVGRIHPDSLKKLKDALKRQQSEDYPYEENEY